MVKRFNAVLVAVLVSACNLSSEAVTETPVPATDEVVAATFVLPATATPAQPTLLAIGATAAPNGERACQVYVTYSGSDPANKLSLRAEPRTSAPQLYRMPNNRRVYLIPESVEVEAEGYHWLNLVYFDESQTRYEGWATRDSYVRGGVRDPNISTLVSTGEQAPC
jgi:hypothetical protein